MLLPRFLIVLGIVAASGMVTLQAQNTEIFWQDISSDKIPSERWINPEQSRSLSLDFPAIQQWVSKAPAESQPGVFVYSQKITLPDPTGGWEEFWIEKVPVMHPELARKYPEIITIAGVAVADHSRKLRLEVTYTSFRAMVFAGEATYFIDPVNRTDKSFFLSYFKKDYVSAEKREFSCGLEEPGSRPIEMPDDIQIDDCLLRTYRLALACTGEYASYHGGTKPGVMSAYVTSMNRVNGVYERESAIRMILVPNTDTLIFLNASTDPYSNNNGGTMLGQNQTTVNQRIGNANYDIGHVFSTGGGGIASLGSVCSNGQKARGVTGSSAPIGDAFDIDYVAHEMGHQFGGNHTQNNNCNREPDASFEPGSASTIMGYAGICSPDVQNHSDDYFHGYSLQEISDFINSSGGTCATNVTIPNNGPTVSAGLSYTIPASTPFELTATGSDADTADVLTYCWEIFDNAVATMPPSANSNSGPNFRSLNPSTSPSRTFPRIQDIVSGATSAWEVLPAVSRVMPFLVTVRDNSPGAGCTAQSNMSVTVDGGSGPFRVSEPNTANVVWIGGTYVDVRWSVANTDVAPVNSPLVNIYHSSDGGYTYPTLLAANVPNTGYARVIAPEYAGTQNRIRVQGANNIFFDISDKNFTIDLAGAPGLVVYTDADTLAACTANDIQVQIDALPLLGYQDTFYYFTQGLPGAIQSVWSANPTVPGSASLTLTNTSSASQGFYPFLLGAVLPSGDTLKKFLILDLQDSTALPPSLLLPAAGEAGVNRQPTLSWTNVAGLYTYDIELASSPAFGNAVIYQESGLATTTISPQVSLGAGEVYFWRVRTINNCGEGSWSAPFAFQTGAETCRSYPATFVPLIFPAFGTNTLNSLLNVSDNFPVQSVKMKSIQGNHDRISDLSMVLRSPLGTEVTLMSGACPTVFNYAFLIGFDDAAIDTLSCPPAFNGTFQPLQPLSAFAGESSTGNWIFKLTDNTFGAGGQIVNYILELCKDTLSPEAPAQARINYLELQRADSATVDSVVLLASDLAFTADQLNFRLLQMPDHGLLTLQGDTLAVGEGFTQQDVNDGLVQYHHDGAYFNSADQIVLDLRNPAGGWLNNQVVPVRIINRTAIDPLKSQASLVVSPVPAHEVLNVSLTIPYEGNWSVALYDLLGNRVQQMEGKMIQGNGTIALQVSELSAGIYLVHAHAGNAHWTRKVIIGQ